jgi:hypothetical protein
MKKITDFVMSVFLVGCIFCSGCTVSAGFNFDLFLECQQKLYEYDRLFDRGFPQGYWADEYGLVPKPVSTPFTLTMAEAGCGEGDYRTVFGMKHSEHLRRESADLNEWRAHSVVLLFEDREVVHACVALGVEACETESDTVKSEQWLKHAINIMRIIINDAHDGFFQKGGGLRGPLCNIKVRIVEAVVGDMAEELLDQLRDFMIKTNRVFWLSPHMPDGCKRWVCSDYDEALQKPHRSNGEAGLRWLPDPDYSRLWEPTPLAKHPEEYDRAACPWLR